MPGPRRQHLQYWLLKIWTGFWGLLFHRNHEIYAYIAESLRRFPDRDELRLVLRKAGFSEVASRRYFFGFMELLVIRKAPEGEQPIA